jgi:hypothetical protein
MDCWEVLEHLKIKSVELIDIGDSIERDMIPTTALGIYSLCYRLSKNSRSAFTVGSYDDYIFN